MKQPKPYRMTSHRLDLVRQIKAARRVNDEARLAARRLARSLWAFRSADIAAPGDLRERYGEAKSRSATSKGLLDELLFKLRQRFGQWAVVRKRMSLDEIRKEWDAR
jgi:hypothetical protein